MQQTTDEQSSVVRFFVPSLVVVYLSLFIVDIISTTFLLDVAVDFFGSQDPLFVAITGQLATISNVIAAVFAILLAVIAIKFNHKKLLLFGTLLVPLGALGCSLAPDYLLLQVFFVLEGIGTMMVTTMAVVLVGEMLPMNRRPQAIGWITSGPTIAMIISTFVVSLFFFTGNWRSFLLWFALPLSFISIVAAYFGIPPSKGKQKNTTGKEAYLRSFRQVFLNKSAAACLIGVFIRFVSLGWGIYIITFLRIEFGIDLGLAVLLAGLPFAVVVTFGHIIGGYLTNRYGRKNLSVASLLIHGVTLPLIVVLPNLWVALTIFYSGTFIGALAFPAVTNLTLEQAPEARGSMMSINSIISILGVGIGPAVGGVALALFDYTGMFFTFAALIILSAAIFFFFTKDPCKTIQTDSTKSKQS